MLYNIVPIINSMILRTLKFVERVNLMLIVLIKHTHTDKCTHTHDERTQRNFGRVGCV